MKQALDWRFKYLKEGLLYRPKSFIEINFWLVLAPEPIKNKFNFQSKKVNNFIYSELKKSFYKNGIFNFKIKHNNKYFSLKYVEPIYINDRHSFAGEFLDLIYPLLIDKEKNKIKNTVHFLKKQNSKKMLWEYNKSKFHSTYYNPIIKKKQILFEGSYFNPEFNLDEKSVVYDIGAHIGIFSILAGVITGNKGKAYAFEPSKRFNKFIKKNIALNNLKNIEIVNVGIGDVEIRGYMNGMKIIEDEKGNTEITTIDKLYESGKINKPDFVKMDIEGFERKALLGGMKLLKNSSPKLSICTYHLKDDHKVLRNIIKKINNKYKIVSNEYNKKYLVQIKN